MEKLCFDFENGRIFRLNKTFNTYELATSKLDNGYLRIGINKKSYLQHRLLYEKYHKIKLKENEEIDHINNIKNDNRICNLRISSSLQNKQNTNARKNNTSGFKGIVWRKDIKKWVAKYNYNKKSFLIGNFENINDARNAYNKQVINLNENNNCYFKII